MKQIKFLSIYVLFLLNVSILTSLTDSNVNLNSNFKSKSEAQRIKKIMNHSKSHLEMENKEHKKQNDNNSKDKSAQIIKPAHSENIHANRSRTLSNTHLLSFVQKNEVTKNILKRLKLKDKTPVLEGWLSVQSDTLNDSKRYPPIPGNDGEDAKIPVDAEGKVTNSLWKSGGEVNTIPSQYFLWARIKEKYLYFSNDSKTLNIILYIFTGNIKGIENLNDENYCMNLFEDKNKWTFCSESAEKTNKWICYLTANIKGLNYDKECNSKIQEVQVSSNIVQRKITQPYIIIPIPQEFCNAKWDYQGNGKEWQCLCQEGKEQSPIDLPKPKKAVKASAKPIFEYKKVDTTHIESLNDFATAGNPVKIQHHHNALRIFHKNFGRIVTLDGSVYVAEEIVFHTPSEHTIEGDKFPMEMQVIHRAKTKGDYGKQLILSFLFKSKAGMYNKFIDSLDFFSLPNPFDKSRNIYEKLFIPNILLNSDDDDTSIIQPFSFYTYQGSLSEPPCVEGVIHYVASRPIELSTTALQMFTEALREPDFQDQSGNIILAKSKKLISNRATQPLNGRTVFYYDHTKYGLPSFTKVQEAEEATKGHYEKQYVDTTEYMFVDGSKPSGIPGAVVVSDDEATK